MAILDFQKPDKVIQIESDSRRGVFEFRPLEPGYGITIGNSLRRILLSSLEGFAVTSVKIDGVDHEFSTIPGVVEDVTEIILNLKQVRFKQQIEDINNETVNLKVKSKGQITAGDIGQFTSAFQVLNPDHVIAHVNDKIELNIQLTINKGRGYVPAEENTRVESAIGVIPVDSIFTPIRNVKYSIENYRVEQKTDYEKLILEIETDGSIMPKEALKESAKILIHHFMLFSDEKITLDNEERMVDEEFDEDMLHMRQLLKSRLVDLDLSVRALNCLKAAEIETLGDLVQFQKNDMLKFRNFGKKSLTELEELVEIKGLSFGMNVVKYKLDKD
jgi:DNA-directed RNA polymerase subunit alpha